MVDLFDEIEEELRTDKLRNNLLRWLPWAIGFVVAILVGYFGYWGYTAWQDRNLATAATAYQKGVDALGQSDLPTALASFRTAASAGSPGYKALGLMQEGNLRLQAGKPDEAAKFYDQAADVAPTQFLGDLARLKAAEALMDTAPYPQLETRLTPLTDAKRPYSIFAREALAMAKLMAGKTADARKDFQVISLNLDAPQDMRQRAELAMAAIDDGEAATAVAAVKAAATLPPPAVPRLMAPPGAEAAPAPAGAAQ